MSVCVCVCVLICISYQRKDSVLQNKANILNIN